MSSCSFPSVRKVQRRGEEVRALEGEEDEEDKFDLPHSSIQVNLGLDPALRVNAL